MPHEAQILHLEKDLEAGVHLPERKPSMKWLLSEPGL